MLFLKRRKISGKFRRADEIGHYRAIAVGVDVIQECPNMSPFTSTFSSNWKGEREKDRSAFSVEREGEVMCEMMTRSRQSTCVTFDTRLI